MAALGGLVSRALAATNPVSFVLNLSISGRIFLAVGLGLAYCGRISVLARRSKDTPCPDFGVLFRVMYGLFGTRLAEAVLSKSMHTPRGLPQPEQHGGTTAVVIGPSSMRIKIVPILGSAFGGNYAFLIWDEADEQKRCIAIDAADPYPVLDAARDAGRTVSLLLTTHWHFDHSGGNRTFARELKGLEVVAAAEEGSRAPAVTRGVHDLDVLRLGDLRVACHLVPGHTRGSVVFEVTHTGRDDIPPCAFTGDTLFCGGCGALFECSAAVLHASFQTLVKRLPPTARIFPGHEYSEMLLTMATKREPNNEAAALKLDEVRTKRARKLPSIPSTISEELAYNPYLRVGPQQLALMCGC